VSLTAGTVYVDVKPDTSAMTGKGSSGLAGAMKSAAALAAVAFAASFVKGSLDEAKEAEKVGLAFADSMSRGTEKFNSAGLAAKFDAINNAMGVSDEQLQTWAMHFNNAIDFTAFGDQADEMLTKMTTLVADVSARTGKSTSMVEKTITKLGTAPETAIPMLEKLGVLTQEQADHALKLVEAGKVEEAQMYAVEAATKATQGAAAAQTTESEKMSIAWGEVQEKVGSFLLPILNSLAGILSTIFGALAEGNPLALGLAAAVGTLTAAIVAYNVYQKIATTLTAIWNAVLNANPIGLIVLAVAALVAGLVLFFTKTKVGIAILQVLKKVGITVFNAIKAVAMVVWNALKTAVMTYFRIYKAIFMAVWNTAKTVWNAVKDIAVGAWNAIKSAWNAVKGFFTGVFNGVKQTAANIWDAIVGAFKGAINSVIGFWNKLDFSIDFTLPDVKFVPGLDGQHITTPDLIPDIPYLAEGGIVVSPTLAMVGEAGREAVIPLDQGGMSVRIVDSNLGLVMEGVLEADRRYQDSRGRTVR
jgi:hypothetical protein